MVTIAEGISAAGLALKAVKDLREIDRSISEAEFKLKIADLSSTLADVKLAMTELSEEMRAKDSRIDELTRAVKRRANLVEKYGYQYEAVEGAPVGRPFCNVCLDDGRFMRVEGRGATYACPKCNAQYPRVPVYRDPADAI